MTRSLKNYGVEVTLWIITSSYGVAAIFALLLKSPSKKEQKVSEKTPLAKQSTNSAGFKSISLLLYLSGRAAWGLAGFVPYYLLPTLMLSKDPQERETADDEGRGEYSAVLNVDSYANSGSMIFVLWAGRKSFGR